MARKKSELERILEQLQGGQAQAPLNARGSSPAFTPSDIRKTPVVQPATIQQPEKNLLEKTASLAAQGEQLASTGSKVGKVLGGAFQANALQSAAAQQIAAGAVAPTAGLAGLGAGTPLASAVAPSLLDTGLSTAALDAGLGVGAGTGAGTAALGAAGPIGAGLAASTLIPGSPTKKLFGK